MTSTEIRKRHRLLVKLGFRPRHFWKRKHCTHYNRANHKYRINCLGNIDKSCVHADFDRWANSTEKTWTWDEFLGVFDIARAAIKAVEGEKA